MIYLLMTALITLTAFTTSSFKVRRVSYTSFISISILFSLVFGFREGLIVSTDLQNYKDMYNNIDFNNLSWIRIEPGYLIYQAFFRYFEVNDGYFILITSFIQLFSFVFLLRIRFSGTFLLVLLFISTPFFYNFSANTIRQGLALLVVFYACSQGDKNNWRWWLLACLGASFHFSVFICFVFVAFLTLLSNRKNWLLTVLIVSPLFFLVSVESLILNALTVIPVFSSLERSVGYALAGDSAIVTGRFFYLLSYILSIILLSNFARITRYVEINHNINKVAFFRLFSLFYFGVLVYPIFFGIGYLLRFASYGLALFPLFLYFLLHSYFSKIVANSCCVCYIALYFFYVRNLFIY